MENQNSVCYVAQINEIQPIQGADNIELAIVGGWNCITKKGEYRPGDNVIIATTDAVIPQELSDAIGVTNYLRKGRVKTVKLRGVYSECLIIPNQYLPQYKTYNTSSKVISEKTYTLTEGKDFMELLKIYKYEPPATMIQLGGGRVKKYHQNPNFPIYYKFPNQKNVPDMFNETDRVEITRKIHGTNARYGIVKKSKLSLWDRVKIYFGNKWAGYEFVVGSHSVEKGSDSQGFYDKNVWYDIAEKYSLKERLWDAIKFYTPNNVGAGFVIYGEIYGPGIQKNYDYGLKDIEFRIFDVQMNGRYCSSEQSYYMTNELGLTYVDVLYTGNWSKNIQDSFVFNNFIQGTKIPHEGVVVKCITGDRHKISKVINPDYLIWSEKHDVGDSH